MSKEQEAHLALVQSKELTAQARELLAESRRLMDEAKRLGILASERNAHAKKLINEMTEEIV